MPTKKQPGAVELLEEDHKKVKSLFEQFEKAKDDTEKGRIADEVDLELRVHSMIEEEILYPAVKDLDSEIVAESFEEHGVVEELLNELATMDLSEDQFAAKFKVMQENVEHHIEEEETNMFPKCSKLPNYEQIGLQMIERKMELLKQLQGDSSGRATEGEPATMRASEKSESLIEGSAKAPPPPGTKSGNQRSQRAAAAAGRRK